MIEIRYLFVRNNVFFYVFTLIQKFHGLNNFALKRIQAYRLDVLNAYPNIQLGMKKHYFPQNKQKTIILIRARLYV